VSKFKIGDKITFEGAGVYCIIDEVEEHPVGVKYWGLWYYKESDLHDNDIRAYMYEEEALPYGETIVGGNSTTGTPMISV
jgi:hypothetical protein